MKPVRVSLGDRSYDVAFGPMSGLSNAVRRQGFAGARAFVVTSRPVAGAGHAGAVERALRRAGLRVSTTIIPDGERHKNLDTLKSLYRQGAAAGLDRKSVVVAAGGGVVTDIAGFFAATYMRGIPFIPVPTTLLGMVDAAIGGKTGVDTPDGKNLVGAFWQPRLVWVDTGVLRTLPRREWRTGFAEILKYGVIGNAAFFEWLRARIEREPLMSAWKPSDVDEAVRRSAAEKARVVSRDEREAPLGGGREILNYGHTAGHALEAATGYGRYSHGEAISIGMAVAGEISLAMNLWTINDHGRVLSVLSAAGLPVRFPRLSRTAKAAFWAALARDKKIVGSSLRFVLPRSIGRVEVRSGISPAVVRRAAERCGF